MTPQTLEEYLTFLQKNQTDLYNALVKLSKLPTIKEAQDQLSNASTDTNVDFSILGVGFPDDTSGTVEGESGEHSYVSTVTHGSVHSVDHGERLAGIPTDYCNNINGTKFQNYYDYTQLPSVRYVFIILYIIVIIVSFVGNFMVIWTVTRNRHMRTVTNYYIRNLAVCDFLVAGLVMPLKLLEYTAPCSWQVFAKDALCSVIYYILPVFVFASVLTLVAISLERCHAIVYPLNSFTMHSKTRTRLILLATWLIPVIVAAPYMYCRSYAFSIHSPYGSLSRQICADRFAEIDMAIYGEEYKMSGRFRKGFFIFIFITMYLLPMIVIVTTCIRIAVCLLKPMDTDPHEESSYGLKMTRKRGENKRRVARMIITVAIAFIVCWSPFYLVSFISQLQKMSFLKKSNFIFTMLATHLFGFLNSAINPFIYHFMSEKFRKSFTIMARSLFCCPQSLLQRNQRRQYSWAMKCEEYYCQHRLQRQQSNSSHSHSKNDFTGQGGLKMLNNYNTDKNKQQTVRTKVPSKSSSVDKANSQATPKGKYRQRQGSSSNSKNSQKNVTVVKNKQNTSLYCGPFCVCECQGCSIQSSSSGPSSSHSHGGGAVPLQGQIYDTQTETQSFGQQQQNSTKTTKVNTNNYIPMKNMAKTKNGINYAENSEKINSGVNGKEEKIYICIDVPTIKTHMDNEEHDILSCRSIMQSRSDSNIYGHDKDGLKIDKTINGLCKSARSSNNLA